MTKIKLIKIAVASSLFIALITGIACNRSAQPKPIVTNSGWALENGQRGQVADFRGKVLLLDFYATWCEPCRDETPHLVALQQRYEAKGFQIIGLNVGGEDDRAEVPAYAKEFGIRYPLVYPDDALVDAYLGMNQNIPQTFVLDRQGNVVRHFVGFGESSGAELERVVEAAVNQTQ